MPGTLDILCNLWLLYFWVFKKIVLFPPHQFFFFSIHSAKFEYLLCVLSWNSGVMIIPLHYHTVKHSGQWAFLEHVTLLLDFLLELSCQVFSFFLFVSVLSAVKAALLSSNPNASLYILHFIQLSGWVTGGSSIFPIDFKEHGFCDSIYISEMWNFISKISSFYFHGKTQVYSILANKIPKLNSN